MRPVLFIALAAGLVSSSAQAACERGSSFCFCSGHARYGVVVTESIDGPKVTVRVERAGTGTTEGQLLELPRAEGEAIGARWLLREVRRQRIDENDTVGCSELGDISGVRAATETVMTALATPDTCDQQLEAAGFVLPCNDAGGRCAVAPAGLVGLAMLAWVRRRRKR